MKRKPTTEKAHVAMSMKQAESLWGISMSSLKIAKSAGCPAFVQSKIYRDDLVKWLEENPKAVGEGDSLTNAAELKRQKTEAEVKLLRAKIAREERETIPLEIAKEEWDRAMLIMLEEARKILEPDHFRIYVRRTETRIGRIFGNHDHQ